MVVEARSYTRTCSSLVVRWSMREMSERITVAGRLFDAYEATTAKAVTSISLLVHKSRCYMRKLNRVLNHGRSQGGVLGVLGPPQSSSHNFFIMEEVVYSTVL